MRAWLAIGAMTLLAVAASSSLHAQGYPMPASSSEPNVICNAQPACSGSLGLPLWPYSPPLKDHTGRFLDSAYTKDWQSGGRTVRADLVRIDESSGRLYIGMGTRFAAYDLSGFFSNLGKPLGKAPRGEEYMRPQADVYPEDKGSGWQTRVMDAQEFLGDYDHDDRGYLYLPYSVWGWGIVRDNGGLSSPVYQDFHPEANPAKVLVLKGSGGRYFVATTNGSKVQIYDATTPASTKSMRTFSQSVVDWAKLRVGGVDLVAVASRTGELGIYSAEAFATGGAPGATFNGYYLVTAGDGSFYAVRRGSASSPATGIAEIRGGSSPSSYSATDYSIEGGLYPGFLQYGAGHLTSAGGTGSGDLRVWKIVNGGLQRIDFFDYFRNHYTVPPAGYAKPDNYTQLIRHALVHQYQGKLYLIVSYDGLGDVYELQGRDSVSVSIDAGRGYGTGNTFSPTIGNGPYYGDRVPFKSSFPTAAVSSVTWNFDNAEAGSAATPTLPIGLAWYQYRGLTSASQITRSRMVTATDPLDSSNADDVSVNLLVPQARVGIKKPNSAVAEVLSGSATREVAVGEQFVDASDGAVEGHISVWEGAFGDRNLKPNEPYTIQGCGAGSLKLTPYYGPYTGVSPALVSADNNPYSPGSVSVNYDAKPFVAALSLSSANTTAPVVFSNSTRIFPTATTVDGAPFFAAGNATTWTVKWEMLAAAGENAPELPVVKQNVVAIGSPSADANVWSLDRSYIKSGRKVRMTVTMDQAAVAGCTTGTISQTAEYALELPKPAIQITGCENVGAACSVTAVPQSGATSNGWSSYRWTVDGTVRSTAAAFDPAFTTDGSHRIELTVGNALGETTVAQTINVDPSLCNGKPTNIAFTWYGNQGCNSATPCKAGETITFNPTAFGYTFQDCDTYAWNFGDGTTSTLKTPTKTYSSNGTRKVSLTVKNSDGQETFTYDVQVGESAPPPPPPPTCELPTTVYPEFVGATSGCSPLNPSTPCRTSETIRLAVTGGLQQVPSCATVSWTLGDGRSTSGRNPSITYSQPGTYNVTATLRASNGATRSGSISIQVTGGSSPSCPVTAPNGLPTVGYSGPTSGCSNANNIDCNRTEAVELTLYSFNYTFQSCDVVVWNFDDGSAPVETNGRVVSHVFAGAKDMYAVTARIKNSQGQSQPGTVNVVFQRLPAEDAPRNAQIGGPTSVRTGQEVQFSGSAEGAVTRWNWNFGDSTTSNQQNPKKTWNTPGTYTVSLSAENSGGASIATQQVVVSDGTAFRYLLPAVARVGGQNNTVWRSDWLIFNPDPAFDPSKPLEIEVELRGSAQTVKKTFVMDASTKVVEDIVKTVFGLDEERGSVIISGVGEAVPQMWTRTYTVSGSGVGTYGQLIPAVRLDATGQSTTVQGGYLMAGLRNTNRFRTNLGVVNPNAEPIEVTVTASDQELGLPLGSTQISVPAYGLVQLSNLPTRIPQIPNDAPYSVILEAAGGKPLIAYGSMIDNVSQDPVYIEAVPREVLTSETMGRQILPGIGKVNSWNSDVTLFNADDKTIQVDILFQYPVEVEGQTVIKTSEAKNVALFANTFLQLDEMIGDGHPVGQLQPVPDGNANGILTIITKSAGVNRYPLIFGRTFNNRGEAGTYGQGISAFASEAANVTPESPAYVPGVRQDPKYYTNLGLVAVDDRPTRVKVTLLDAITGEPKESREYTLLPYQSIIVPRVIENIGSLASNGSLKIEITGGGRAWAFASVVDQTTADPEYVPAISFQQ